MAGGEGSRLRPLTCDIPKPMARLCGRPVLEYILELLAEHGVEEAALTMRYLPDRIADHFSHSRHAGVRLDFVEEDMPLGTAGSVKNACAVDDDDILIISGDAMCDFDLSAFTAFHKKSGADVTILGKRVEDPREYGLIDIEGEGRIRGFIEKPAFSQAVSDLANTGIYLLSNNALRMIPDGVSYDFAKDLFPAMLGEGKKLMCWEGEGYWCDIGDLDSYIRCQRDMLQGLVRCNIEGTRDAAGNIFAGNSPNVGVSIHPPVYIGRGVRIEEGVLLESGTVVDDGCFIGHSARVSGSVLLQDVYIGQRARLTGALVCATATVKRSAMLFEGATVGAGAVVGEKAVLNSGIKVWNKKRIPASAIVDTHVKTAAQAKEFFDDDGIAGEIGVELTPEFAVRVGAAVGSYAPAGRIAVGCSTHPAAKVLKAALCAGIQSTGADIIDFGENFQSQFTFSMNFCAVPTGIFIRGDNKACIKLLSSGGLPASRDMERGIEIILSRGEFARCDYDSMGSHVEMSGMATMYKSQLVRYATRGLTGCTARVKSHNLTVKNTLKEVLHRLGCDVSTGMVIEVSSQGDKVRIYDPSLGYIPHHKIFTWCCLGEMERGEDVAVPYDAPRAIDAIAEGMGRKVLRYYTCPADSSDEDARKIAKSQIWSRDGLMQAVMFLSMARRAGSVEALLRRTPQFERAVRTFETGTGAAALMRELDGGSRETGGIPEGVVLRRESGTVLVRPLKRGTGLRIFAEAVSAEAASDLCDDVERWIREKLDQ